LGKIKKMFELIFPLVLGSKSPRRSKLLKDSGLAFEVLNIEVDESYPLNLKSESIPTFISDKKWHAAKVMVTQPHSIILTADTMVFLDEKPLGKPKDWEEAIYFLNLLSNKTHRVITGFSLGLATGNSPQISKAITTKVTFYKLSNKQIEDYVASGSPFDKAGGYGYQDDAGASFVKKIEGLTSNVIGLPVEEVISSMDSLNFFKKNS
jgi:septum formation protein